MVLVCSILSIIVPEWVVLSCTISSGCLCLNDDIVRLTGLVAVIRCLGIGFNVSCLGLGLASKVLVKGLGYSVKMSTFNIS